MSQSKKKQLTMLTKQDTRLSPEKEQSLIIEITSELILCREKSYIPIIMPFNTSEAIFRKLSPKAISNMYQSSIKISNMSTFPFKGNWSTIPSILSKQKILDIQESEKALKFIKMFLSLKSNFGKNNMVMLEDNLLQS